MYKRQDAERIGILGICGWGGMALNAAAIDTRIKATVTVTMYDIDVYKRQLPDFPFCSSSLIRRFSSVSLLMAS